MNEDLIKRVLLSGGLNLAETVRDRIEELERERDQAWNAAIHNASAIAKSGVEAYGAKMRVATDKKEKRDWQSMLMAAVDIEHAILTLLKGAKE